MLLLSAAEFAAPTEERICCSRENFDPTVISLVANILILTLTLFTSVPVLAGRQVWWTVGILWWPLGIACAAIVSKAVAEKSGPARIRKIANMCLKIIVVLGVVGGLATFFFSPHIPRIFVSEPAYLAAATASLRMMAPLLAVSSVMDGLDSVLIASGDGAVNTLMTGAGVAACVARLLIGPVSCVTHIWEGLLLSYIIRAVLNVGRFLVLYGQSRTDRVQDAL